MIRFDFTGKNVLITGGTRGIGLAIADAFLVAGAAVHITGTRPDASAYEEDLSRFVYHQVRLDDRAQRQALAPSIHDLDILVNNAGQARDDEYQYEGFANTIEVNLNAVAELCYEFHPVLAARHGAIVNIGSSASFIALKHVPAYTASKAGLLGLTRALADQWASDGIRVNVVAPGFVDTQIIDWAKQRKDGGAALLRTIPAHRWGEPREVAVAVLFMASANASYITGQSLIIDGGLMLR
jgi:3-oxoacyl-[acyl-carrier protein] reductase